MTFISNLSDTRLAWGLLFLSTLLLEAYALYTQHAMDLRPCTVSYTHLTLPTIYSV